MSNKATEATHSLPFPEFSKLESMTTKNYIKNFKLFVFRFFGITSGPDFDKVRSLAAIHRAPD